MLNIHSIGEVVLEPVQHTDMLFHSDSLRLLPCHSRRLLAANMEAKLQKEKNRCSSDNSIERIAEADCESHPAGLSIREDSSVPVSTVDPSRSRTVGARDFWEAFLRAFEKWEQTHLHDSHPVINDRRIHTSDHTVTARADLP